MHSTVSPSEQTVGLVDAQGDPKQPSNERSSRRIRIRNRAWLAIIVIVSVTSALAGFVVSDVVGQSPKAALDKADTKITVTAPAEIRLVDSSPTYSGNVVAGSTANIVPLSLPDTPVLTRQGLNVGDTVSAGSFLGTVADIPTFALVGNLPLYRDLRLGDSGDDVKALQEGLSQAGLIRNVAGRIDPATLTAIARLFERAGYKLPTETSPSPTIARPDATKIDTLIPVTAFVGLPADKLPVVAAASVSSRVGDKNALISVQTSADAVVFRASPDAVSVIKSGMTVSVRTAAATVNGTIESIGKFLSGGDGQVPGRDVRVAVDPAALGRAGVGTNVIVTLPGASVKGLAVPTIAIREDAHGSYVLVLGRGNKGARVDVSTTAFGGGWTAVSDTKLHKGDRVITS